MKLRSQEPRPKQFCGNRRPALLSRALGTAVRSRAVFWARSTDCSLAPGTRSGCSGAKGRQRPPCSRACLAFSRSSAQGPGILPLSLTLGPTPGRVANPVRGLCAASAGEIRLSPMQTPKKLLWTELCPPSNSWGVPGSCQSTCQCRRCGFDPWVGKMPWRRAWQPIPVLLPGEFHGQRSLAGYSPWGCKESDKRMQHKGKESEKESLYI